MKNRFNRILALLAVLLVIASLLTVLVSATGQPSSYSSVSNSGQRHVECTSLAGTGAEDYYTGNYTYDNLSDMTSSNLLTALRTLMTTTHKKTTSYDDCRNYSGKTDCQNNDGKVVLLYTSYVATTGDFSGSAPGWNREHVWPKSLGGFETSGAGADLHHIRPDDVTTNSKRGNKKFGNVSGGTQATGSALVNGQSGGTYSGNYFEPHDEVKGDVARICLYVYVRWGGQYSQCSSITNVFQSIDVLLEWCELDPVDTWEMGRNEVVEGIQGNRNVFIDYPEYAWLLFGRQIPNDLQSPSGEGGTACRHQTQITGAYPATCTTPGFTGNTVCTICGATVKAGTVIPASHSYSAWTVTVEATCTASGTKTRECSVCHNTNTDTIAATGHSMGSWIPISSPVCESPGEAKRECANCDYCETQFVDPTGHTLGDWITLIAPTCENSGSAKRECQNCDFEESKVLEPTGHTLVYTPYQAPTKTSVGWEAYEKCNSCSYTTYKEIPKIIDTSEFVKAVGEIDVTAYPVVLYEQIEKAKALYKELSDDEKALASKEIATLNSAIDAYNLMVEDVNSQHADTLKTAFAPITVCFVFLSLFISFIEKHFKP